MNRIIASTAAALVGSLALVGAALPAEAKSSADVVARGSCTGASDWKLKASPENGRIEVEGEVDSNVNGQVWRWRLLHDGVVSATGLRTTQAPSGSFTVRRLMVDLPGGDRIAWRARNLKTGELCRGSLTF